MGTEVHRIVGKLVLIEGRLGRIEENMTADDSGFKERLPDFEIVCRRMDREHWVINEKLDRIEKASRWTEKFLHQHDDDSMKLIGELECKLDRIEKEQRHFNKVMFEDRCFLERIEKLQNKMRDNVFTIRKRTDDIEKMIKEKEDFLLGRLVLIFEKLEELPYLSSPF